MIDFKRQKTAPGASEAVVLLLLGVLLSLLSWPSISRAESGCPESRVVVGFKTHDLTKTTAALSKARQVSGPIRKRRRQAMESVVSAAGAGRAGAMDLGPNNILVQGEAEASKVASALSGVSSDVRYAECDAEVQVDAAQPVVPNDPGFSSLWGLQSGYLNCPAAWAVTQGSPNVVVAVIDTGVDYNHPDLSSVMYHNPDTSAPDVYGYDFVNNDNDPWDDHYHGTHVAGTIGARGDNGVGVVGVNWNARIMALKVLSSSGSGYMSGIISAVYYAVQKKSQGVNVRVMNMSLGGGGYMQSFKDAIDSAGSAGIMLVAAAGNASNNNDVNPFYPASYTSASLISVAATTQTGLAYFSNYGLTSVDVGAPGYSIYSTLPNNGYGYLSGTSMASPHVAGLAALILAVQPNYTIAQVKDLILSSGTAVSYLSGITVSGKLISAANAIAAAGGGGNQITGSVKDSGGNAISGVAVNAGSLGTQVTTSSGIFAFGPVEAGTAYTVTPSSSCASFSPPSATGTMPSSGLTLNFVGSIYQYSLSGKVIDAGRGGTPISGAQVAANWGGGSVSTVSDANGAYSLIIPCGASYTVSVTKSGFGFDPLTGIMSGNRTYNFSPSSALYNYSGRVLGEGGSGLQAVVITARNQTTGAVVSVASDAAGDYSLALASGQSYLISAAKTGYTFFPGSAVYYVSGDSTLNFSASINRYKISGQVTTAAGPVSGALVSADGLGSALTDANGGYQISGVPYGSSYTLTVSREGYSFSPSSKSGTVSGDVTVNFTGTINSYTIQVKVANSAGIPISGVLVVTSTSGILTTNSSGLASISLAYGRSFAINLSHAGYTLSPSSFSGTVSGNVVLQSVATQKTFSISGLVRSSGVGIGGALVSIPGIGSKLTAGDGSFVFSNIPALTTYSISVTKAGYNFAPMVARGTLISNTTVIFNAGPALFIEGYVRMNGAPIAGARVYGGSPGLGVRLTDSNGYYSFMNLAPGTAYNLSASMPGYNFSANGTTGTLNDPVRIDFTASQALLSIRGKVAFGEIPLAGVTVDAGPLGSTVTDSAGSYSFANIPYGTVFRLRAVKSGYSFWDVNGRVNGDVTANIYGLQILYRINGLVASAGMPVSKAKVSCGAYSVLSGMSGAYSIGGLPYGTICTLSASKGTTVFGSVDVQVTDNLNINF